MQVTTIFGHEFTTIASLKSFAAEHGFSPIGNKALKLTWVEAVTFYLASRMAVVEIAIEAEQVSAESSEAIEAAVVSVGSLVVAALTSELSIGFYRGVLKFAVFAIVVTTMFAMAAVKWCWDHRSKTAVYHWIMDALDSSHGRSALTQLLILEWVVAQWGESIGEVRDRIISEVRTIGSDGLMRLGLGGCAIEIQ